MKSHMAYWDEQTGVAYYVIIMPDGTPITGTARCHPRDVDMMSEKTGCSIAEMRATIKALKYHKKYVLKPELKALKKFYFTINQSKYYNPEDYSNQMLARAIHRLEDEVIDIDDVIKYEQEKLSNYMEEKAKFWNSVRSLRNKKAENK